jgi:lipoprotein-anchoring transpeptidase ErfK/SrfK
VVGRAGIAITAVALGWLAPVPAEGAQRTAKLLHRAVVRAAPAGRVVGSLAATRPLTGSPTVVPVVAVLSAGGRAWLRVRLPQRPNGTTGWIAEDGTAAGVARWSVVVTRSRRRASVYGDGRRVRSFGIVVGKPATPTPLGRFFVAERVRQARGSELGPWVLATSAYSDVLRQFGGGPGQIGLHGRTGLPDPLGTAASHGCVRFSDRAIAWLATRAGPGTPVIVGR